MEILKKLYRFSQSWTGTVVIVLLVIFFFIQAFVIPSGSMKNTLLVGDFLFVKKFSYGIPTPHIPWLELPVLPDFNKDGHLIKAKGPQRGDIVVFRNPRNKKEHFVKRCVGLGGDRIVYSNKTLYVRMHEGDDFMKEHYPNDLVSFAGQIYVKEPYKQKGIHYDPNKDIESDIMRFLSIGDFAMSPTYFKELGNYIGFSGGNAYVFDVPENEYFMVGDNRDYSYDSRFWGSVPYSLIVGKPWFVYFSWDQNKNVRWERIGRFIDTLENDEKYIHDHDDEDKLS
ncbi:signal peptidase I [Campylobacter sp. VicNov18]|uniref:signal peptidase I n=1 Tax=Campylobacter bilis TaxID=2691918 RepID=UPI00130DA296|nr:signal peptidase I [Campylobacter bilis]MPV63539.1 signal peptidase I [Campylobacter hepaticus]MBM0637039.1 signal peptidase I [Campylobacter bilis]MCC8277804.1 signal peptidase I [Campylobacter bilis]MCC8299413.1 signal peptidase I [Campylobacter bilis]MCC8300713.1 signal peptidase I [Campylobacter bilis]